MSSGKFSHECFRASYIEAFGAGKVASAKAPTGTAMKPGILSMSKYTVEPHVGQKRNVIDIPASPTRT